MESPAIRFSELLNVHLDATESVLGVGAQLWREWGPGLG